MKSFWGNGSGQRVRSVSAPRGGGYQSIPEPSNDCAALDDFHHELKPISSIRRQRSSDEFRSIKELAESAIQQMNGSSKPSIKSGRQRKKQAVRTKGGEFQARRKKRRVYFCSISSEIDVEKIYDDITLGLNDLSAWKRCLYTNVLHLYLSSDESTNYEQHEPSFLASPIDEMERSKTVDEARGGPAFSLEPPLPEAISRDDPDIPFSPTTNSDAYPLTSQMWASGNKEVFVFDFGAIVFWGFSLGEEENLLAYIRSFTLLEDNLLIEEEFTAGEDDMAFVASSDTYGEISIANDVFTLPDDSTVRQRLAISFAIAQSSVLAIFEARIEKKVDEFKYIPERFAKDGGIKLSSKKLGRMIGDVFVIRHDVNLHTEILDTPEWFWGNEDVVHLYKLLYEYLEMTGRTEILNKRLDMLKQLLSMLQQQNESEHNVKLEWIIIWLIIVSVALELLSVGGKVLGWWD